MAEEETYSLGKFVLDRLSEKGYIGPFDAWSTGEEWNGWAAPFFERPEAERVLREFIATGGEGKFDVAQDTFHFLDDASKEWQEYEGESVTTPLGSRTVYAIGVGDWIWDYAEPENGTTG